MTKNDGDKLYPNHIRHYIKQQGYTIQEVADKVGIPRRTLTDYISGIRPVPRDNLKKLARMLACSINDLIAEPVQSYPSSLVEKSSSKADIASKTALLIGRISFDQSNHVAANNYNKVSFEAVQETGNDALRAVVLGRVATIPTNNGQPPIALPLLQEARRLSAQSATLTTRAWLAAKEAEMWANVQEEVACLKALEEAELITNQLTPEEDPYWTNFDRPLMLGFKGVCCLQRSMLTWIWDCKERSSLLQVAAEALGVLSR